MRMKLYLLAGVAFTIATASHAGEQTAPVVFATDPGAAHPKYIGEELKAGKTTKKQRRKAENKMSVEELMASEPALPTVDQAQVDQARAADLGGFDYGYSGSGATQVAKSSTASSGPTKLVTVESGPIEGTVSNAVMKPTATGPYRQDPIYKITEESAQQAVVKKTNMAYNAPAQTGRYVEVAPGDTVYALSRRYGVSANAIIVANKMPAPYALQVGQVIFIPEAGQVRQTNPNYSNASATIDQSVPKQAARSQVYIVRPGNTLYSIARAFGHDVKTIAAANNIPAPYTLSVGQQIVIPMGAQIAGQPQGRALPSYPRGSSTPETRSPYDTVQKPFQREASIPQNDAPRNVSYAIPEKVGDSRFTWPIQGKVVMGYGLGEDGRRNDGINIAAPVGTPIRAVDDGEVVYRGSDLEGYGNLLLIKHSGGWVSAYAHTDAMLVRKGEKVRQGQVVAKVGTTGTVGQPQLHFELRHDLKPTDPLAALEGRNKLAVQ